MTLLEPISAQRTIIESDVFRISNCHILLIWRTTCVRPIHLAAALLDPRLCDNLTGKEQT